MTTYAEWLPSLLPAPLAGRWGTRWASTAGTALDEVLVGAKAAVKVRFVSIAPLDAVPLHGRDRGIAQLPGEPVETYRARLIDAWETWRWAGTARAIRLPLVALGLRGVTVVPFGVWPFDTLAARWSRFQVYVSGHVAPGEVLSGAFDSGDYLGAGLDIVPLLSPFISGSTVSGTVAVPATVERVRGAVKKWKAARDRGTAVVFTWGGTISGAFLSGVPTGVGPEGQPPVSWRGSLDFA